jgi:hypothetical protein
MAMTVMADPQSVTANVNKRLSISTYTYVNGDGSLKGAGQMLLIRYPHYVSFRTLVLHNQFGWMKNSY